MIEDPVEREPLSAGEQVHPVDQCKSSLMAKSPRGLCLRGVERGECLPSESLVTNRVRHRQGAFENDTLCGNDTQQVTP